LPSRPTRRPPARRPDPATRASTALQEPRAIASDPVTSDAWLAGLYQTALTMGTQSLTSANKAVFLFRWNAAARAFDRKLSFEAVGPLTDIDAGGVVVDVSGKVTLWAHANGAVRINSSLVLTPATPNVLSVFVVQAAASGAVLSASMSVNPGGDMTATAAALEAGGGLSLHGRGSGALTLLGQSITVPTNSAFQLRVNSAGAGTFAAATPNLNLVSGACYHAPNARTYVVGRGGAGGNNFAGAAIDAAGVVQASFASSFSGAGAVNSMAEAYAVACGGVSIVATGSTKTAPGVVMNVGSLAPLATPSTTETLVIEFNAALAPSAANKANGSTTGIGRSLVRAGNGLYWGAGVLLGPATFSGVTVPEYANEYTVYMSSIGTGAVYANLSVVDNTAGAALQRGMSVGPDGKLLQLVKVTGTTKWNGLVKKLTSGSSICLVTANQ
jgi:hypothetical protein